MASPVRRAPRRGRHPGRAAATLALLLAAGCQLSTPGEPGGGIGGAPVVPTATTPGVPQGPAETATVDASGGAFTAAGGAVQVAVPAGSLAAPTTFTVTPISSRAPGALGPSWRVEASQPLTGRVELTFRGLGAYRAGQGVTSLGVRTQDARGFWVAPEAVRHDVVADTVTATTAHLSDWALVLAGPPALEGTFTLVQGVGIPFSATGTAALYAWTEAGEPTYYLTGTITLPPSLNDGGATCVPDGQTKSLDLSVAEVHDAVFRWGIPARWTLTCTDGASGAVTTRDLGTTFDTMRINLGSCPGAYLDTQVNGPAFVQGKYQIACAGGGTVTAAWDFRACTPGGACQPAEPCRTGAVTCALGVGSCTPATDPAGWLADGTPCSSATAPAGTCLAGACQ